MPSNSLGPSKSAGKAVKKSGSSLKGSLENLEISGRFLKVGPENPDGSYGNI